MIKKCLDNVRWRVNLDIYDNMCVADKSKDINKLIDYFLESNIELCLIDIKKCQNQNNNLNSKLINYFINNPNKIWYGGGIRSIKEIECALKSGAAGVNVGSMLFNNNRFNINTFREIIDEFGVEKIIFSIDYNGDLIFKSGFTVSTSIKKYDVLNLIYDYNEAVNISLVDINASRNHKELNWREIEKIRSEYPKLNLWYGGNISKWEDVYQLNELRVNSILGQNYLKGKLGLGE